MMEKYLSDLFHGQQYKKDNFFLIAGPCVVESEASVMEIAEKVAAISKKLGIPYIFKASYRKANRTSASSFTGIGDGAALELIKKAGSKFNLPTLTDIYAADETANVPGYVDALLIPALLCPQTELLIAAAITGKVVNVKKGQFLSGPSMKFAIEKINNSGNNKVMLTEM